VPFEKFAVTVPPKLKASPTKNEVLYPAMEMLESVTGVESLTVTEQLPDLDESTVEVAEIVAEPALIAVTTPEFDTVATSLLEEDQFTV
jgi:hypothetical protein